jgi:hypothetical protein
VKTYRIIILIITLWVSIIISIIIIELALNLFSKTNILHLDNNTLSVRRINVPVYYDLSSPRIYKSNPNIDFNEFDRTDKYGFRLSSHFNKLHSSIRKSTTMIMIGDSFTYGHMLKPDDAYPAQIEKLFNENGNNMTVFNAGISGYGTDQEYVYIIDELIPKFSPDLIVWNININDIGDSDEECLFKKTYFGFVKFPGWLNSLYMEGFTKLKINNLILKTKTFQLIYNLIKKRRVTIGCSRPADTPINTLINIYSDKVKYFVSNLHEKYPNQKIIFVLVPFRDYFQSDNPLRWHNQSGLIYKSMLKIFGNDGYPFIDINPIMLSDNPWLKKPELIKANSNWQSYLDNISSEDITNALFFNEDGQDKSASHLNINGNYEFAYSMYKLLMKFDYTNYIFKSGD